MKTRIDPRGTRMLPACLALGALLAAAAEVPAAPPAPVWQEIIQHGDIPPPLWEAGATFAKGGGDILYRFGGASGVFPADFPVDDFYALDLATATWTNLASPTTPAARSNPLLIPGRCHLCVSLVGGRGQFDTGLMFREMSTYDPRTGSWTRVETPADLGDRTAIRRAAALVTAVRDPAHPRRITYYAFGGVGSTVARFPTVPGGLRKDLAAWDLKTGWRIVPTFGEKPVPRAWTTGAYVPATHSLLVFGGYRLGADQGPDTPGGELFGPSNFENDLWSLSLHSFTWRKLQPQGPVPTPRDNVASFFDTSRSLLVAFGGQGFDRVTHDLWTYSLAENRWTRVTLPPGAPVPPGRVGGVSFVRETPDAFELYLHAGVTSESGNAVLLNDLWKLTWPKE
jgi:Galactose oxidase, central domain